MKRKLAFRQRGQGVKAVR